eukprot:m.96806 g.96806  ORF g.96806 m.96806 type:complete len:224 (+) comp10183_c0_seq3:252-923(+)
MADRSRDRSEVYAIYIISSLALVGITVLYSGYRKQNKLRKLGHKWSKWMPELVKQPPAKITGPSRLNAAIINGVNESFDVTRTMQAKHAVHWEQLRARRSNEGGHPHSPPKRNYTGVPVPRMGTGSAARPLYTKAAGTNVGEASTRRDVSGGTTRLAPSGSPTTSGDDDWGMESVEGEHPTRGGGDSFFSFRQSEVDNIDPVSDVDYDDADNVTTSRVAESTV